MSRKPKEIVIHSDEYAINIQKRNTQSILKRIKTILESQSDKTTLYFHLTKPVNLTLTEALSLVNLPKFIERYKISIRYLSHKKHGYNTAGHPYEFTSDEVHQLSAALHKLADDLKTV